MNITIKTSTLVAELAKVQAICAGKTTLPILHTVRLRAFNGAVEITATDLDIALVSLADCDVSQDGAVCVSARDLYVAAKGLPARAETVTLATDDAGWLVMTAGTVRARFVTLDTADFPTLPETATADGVHIDGVLCGLGSMVDRTVFAVSQDEGRRNLRGAHVTIAHGLMTMAGTDGHRMCVVTGDVGAGPHTWPESGVIIPRKGLLEIARLAAFGPVTLSASAAHVTVRQGTSALSVRVIDAAFPAFRSIIPARRDGVTVDRADFLARMKFVAMFANEKTHSVTVAIEDGTMRLSAMSADKGECAETLDVGGDLRVTAGFSWRYLADVLGALTCETIDLDMRDALSPAVIRAVGEDLGTFVVMPMRL